MLYDIPPRSVVPIEVETLVRLAEHPRIVAVKDAKGDLGAVAWTLARTDLAYYSGEDMLNLPLLSLGAVGVVSVVGHIVGPRLAELISAMESGDLVKARAVNESLLPVYTGIFHPGAILVKAALHELGLPSGPVGPARRCDPEQVAPAAPTSSRGRRPAVSVQITQPHLDLQAPAPARGGLARDGAGRARRDRPQHGRARVRGSTAGHRLRRPVPGARAAGST